MLNTLLHSTQEAFNGARIYSDGPGLELKQDRWCETARLATAGVGDVSDTHREVGLVRTG